MEGKVLVVEPDEQARLVLEHLMNLEGYQVTALSTAMEALEAVKDQDYDIVLASAHMTIGPDGSELVRRLKERQPGMQSILLTGDDKAELAGIPDDLRKDTDVNIIAKSMGSSYLAAFTANGIEYKRLMSALDRLSESGKVKLARKRKP